MNKLNVLLTFIEQADAKGDTNETQTSVTSAVRTRVKNNEPIKLICFTCSTIQSEYLFSDTPWLYVDTRVDGNNLIPDLDRLATILKNMRAIYPTNLDILIGNTDPYYIYLRQFKDLARPSLIWEQFKLRWQTYTEHLQSWLDETYPELQATVISWYAWEKQIEARMNISFEREYEKTLETLEAYVSQKNLDWELSQLQTQFGPGKYFENLSIPDETLLKDWVRRKCAEYAVQAKWLYEYMPNSILIQNEKPSDLRSAMYQPLIEASYGTQLPIVYFFGVDNAGYQ